MFALNRGIGNEIRLKGQRKTFQSEKRPRELAKNGNGVNESRKNVHHDEICLSDSCA